MLRSRTHLLEPPQPRALGTTRASGALATLGRGGVPRGTERPPSSELCKRRHLCRESRAESRVRGSCARPGFGRLVLRPGRGLSLARASPRDARRGRGAVPEVQLPRARPPRLRARVTAARLLKGAAAARAPGSALAPGGFDSRPEGAGPRSWQPGRPSGA